MSTNPHHTTLRSLSERVISMPEVGRGTRQRKQIAAGASVTSQLSSTNLRPQKRLRNGVLTNFYPRIDFSCAVRNGNSLPSAVRSKKESSGGDSRKKNVAYEILTSFERSLTWSHILNEVGIYFSCLRSQRISRELHIWGTLIM